MRIDGVIELCADLPLQIIGRSAIGANLSGVVLWRLLDSFIHA
jgi:hypothetical protein